MSTNLLIVILALVLLGSLGILAFVFFKPEKSVNDLQSLMRANKTNRSDRTEATLRSQDQALTNKDFERLKKQQRKKLKSKKKVVTIEEKLYHAGIFTKSQKLEFDRLKIVCPAVLAPGLAVLLGTGTGQMIFAVYGLLIGAIVGLKWPFILLNRRIKKRNEEILYFLPLVIEQISIGVSSSLDIGPCLQRVVSMADERDSHNVVTELIRHAQHQMKSGVSMEEAMTEIGIKAGHVELKHAFMALSQVAKHGGGNQQTIVRVGGRSFQPQRSYDFSQNKKS